MAKIKITVMPLSNGAYYSARYSGFWPRHFETGFGYSEAAAVADLHRKIEETRLIIERAERRKSYFIQD